MFLASASPSGHLNILLTLLIMWVAAKLMAEIFERLRQPAVAGEILAGVIIGPSMLAWVAPNEITATLAEIGVIFLLFTVGLETSPRDIFRVGRRAVTVAILGVVVPLGCGYLLMRLWGASDVQSLFIGTAMVATSVGVTARVLGALGVLEEETSRIILGAAVIDDILGLLVLAMVSSIAGGTFDVLEIALTASLAIGFTLFVLFVGAPAVTKVAPGIDNLKLENSLFYFGLGLCLALSVAAGYIGIAAIIGAFLAGMALADATKDNGTMHRQMNGVTEFLVPFFLVGIGMHLKLDVFRDPTIIVLTLLVTVVAVITKLVGGGVGVLAMGWRNAAIVGTGMVPRGEVGVIVAQIGLGLAVINDSLYGVVLFMAVATTLIAPPFLKLLHQQKAVTVADT